MDKHIQQLYTFVLPIYWTQKNKTILCSMNWYRNAHYYSQNNMKKYFHHIVWSQLPKHIKTIEYYSISMKLFYKNKNCDPSNITALIEKFLLDALQEHKIILNDSITYHLKSQWEVIAQDKQNPRCEITLIKE